jgi:hypothetical protein
MVTGNQSVLSIQAFPDKYFIKPQNPFEHVRPCSLDRTCGPCPLLLHRGPPGASRCPALPCGTLRGLKHRKTYKSSIVSMIMEN